MDCTVFSKLPYAEPPMGFLLQKRVFRGKPGKQQFERMRPIIRLLAMNALMRL